MLYEAASTRTAEESEMQRLEKLYEGGRWRWRLRGSIRSFSRIIGERGRKYVRVLGGGLAAVKGEELDVYRGGGAMGAEDEE
jgi:hypothetical protein